MLKLGKEAERKILIYASAIIIAFLMFSSSLFIVLIDRELYDKNFKASGAYDKIGVDGIRNTADSIINYLLGYNGDANTADGFYVFTQNEKSHMQDVHDLFNKVKYATVITIAILLIFILRMRANGTLSEDLSRSLKYSGIKIFIALATIFFLSLNFDWLFVQFHYIFFPQGNWQFPVDSLLIIMFPQAFFEEYAKKMGVQILLAGIILFSIGSLIEYRSKPQQTQTTPEPKSHKHKRKDK